MLVNNITKSTIITENLKIASSWLDKIVGLLSQNNPRSLLFETRFGIHTFGLKEPIDLIILDKTGMVVKLKQNCLPNRLYFWNPRFNKILELPRGSIKKSRTGCGDLIEIA